MTYFGRYLQLSFLKLPRHFLLFKKNFNWRIISLQHFVGFSCATTSISHKYPYIPSLQSLPPTSILPLYYYYYYFSAPLDRHKAPGWMTPQSCYWTYTLREPELKKTHYPVIHCNTVDNSQDMEAASMSISRWMDKDVVLCLCAHARTRTHAHRLHYHSAVKRSGFASVELRWMKLEFVIQSEVNQRGKQISHISLT